VKEVSVDVGALKHVSAATGHGSAATAAVCRERAPNVAVKRQGRERDSPFRERDSAFSSPAMLGANGATELFAAALPAVLLESSADVQVCVQRCI